LPIDEVRDGIESMSYLVADGVFGRVIQSRFYGVKSNMHVFYSQELAYDRQSYLFAKVKDYGQILKQLSKISPLEIKKYSRYYNIKVNNDNIFTYSVNYDKIDFEDKNSEFFCILSNIYKETSDILNVYKQKRYY
jgi:cytidylate kinase